MPAGNLTSVFAFEVSPKQETGFRGGHISPDADLQAALDKAFEISRIDSAPFVNLHVDTADESRPHPVRDAAQQVAFGPTGAALDAAGSLARRLALAMDHRSKPTLLMISVHSVSATAKRRVVIWTFPQQEVFRLNKKAGQANLDLLEVFIRESKLRKAAMLEGGESRVDFLHAQVLDFQASAADRAAADLWIVKFLDATSQMSSAEGTKTLAKALRHIHTRNSEDADAQAQINAAITGLRASKKTRWSLDEVAKTYFDSSLSSDFTSKLNPVERQAVFAVDRSIFDSMVKYRVFTLDNGVLVSAPFTEVEVGPDGSGAVKITEEGTSRWLKVEGAIEGEKVRTRG